MAPIFQKMALHENPNITPSNNTVKPAQSATPRRQFSPTAMYRDDYPRQHSPYQRSRSPPRPLQPVRVHDDGLVIEELNADNRNLLDQLEKLSMKLDTANVEISSQMQRIKDLEKQMETKTTLIEEYQKLVRTNRVEKEGLMNSTSEVVEQCERFRSTIIKLSHRIHYMDTAIEDAKIPDQLKERLLKLKKENDLVKDDLIDQSPYPRVLRKRAG